MGRLLESAVVAIFADGPADNMVFKFQFFSDSNLRKHLENAES